MGRPSRGDYEGAWHHVMNRRLARRPVFETARDVSVLLEGLETQVREGRIEVHASCVLTTRSRALLRSVTGELSEAIPR